MSGPSRLGTSSHTRAHTVHSPIRSAHETRCVSVLEQRSGVGCPEHSQRPAATRLENIMCSLEDKSSIESGPGIASPKASKHAPTPVRNQRPFNSARRAVDENSESGWRGRRAFKAGGLHLPNNALHGRCGENSSNIMPSPTTRIPRTQHLLTICLRADLKFHQRIPTCCVLAMLKLAESTSIGFL